VQKPYKVLAEQYLPGTTPPPPDAATRAGLCVCTVFDPFADGRPHVHGRTQVYELHAGDWTVQELWAPYDWYVIPDAEFQDRFGGTGGAPLPA
jgi:hypothetical protein